MHMMQLWVNLPSKDKKAPPGYQPIHATDVPSVALATGGSVRVLAGEFGGVTGPARTFTPITMLDARLTAGEVLSVSVPATYNALAVVAEGQVSAGEQRARAGELLLFHNDAAHLSLVASQDAHVIVLAGEPIAEPIVQYGPFVMNSVEEIEEAIRDIERGKFGPIPD